MVKCRTPSVLGMGRSFVPRQRTPLGARGGTTITERRCARYGAAIPPALMPASALLTGRGAAPVAAPAGNPPRRRAILFQTRNAEPAGRGMLCRQNAILRTKFGTFQTLLVP